MMEEMIKWVSDHVNDSEDDVIKWIIQKMIIWMIKWLMEKMIQTVSDQVSGGNYSMNEQSSEW